LENKLACLLDEYNKPKNLAWTRLYGHVLSTGLAQTEKPETV